MATKSLTYTVRSLTEGEKALITSAYGDKFFDLSAVKIYQGKFFMGQGDQIAMAPNGNIYLPSSIYSDDFSSADAGLRALFTHETIHLLQYALDLVFTLKAAVTQILGFVTGTNPYAYNLTSRLRTH